MWLLEVTIVQLLKLKHWGNWFIFWAFVNALDVEADSGCLVAWDLLSSFYLRETGQSLSGYGMCCSQVVQQNGGWSELIHINWCVHTKNDTHLFNCVSYLSIKHFDRGSLGWFTFEFHQLVLILLTLIAHTYSTNMLVIGCVALWHIVIVISIVVFIHCKLIMPLDQELS